MLFVPCLLAACGGFLLAVLWMDLMFDVQVLKHRRQAELPEPVLASIAAYYRRVTTTASPMGHLVGTVMMLILVTLLIEAFTGGGASGWLLASFVLAGGPIGLAFARVVGNAIRLGSRADPVPRQSQLARTICFDHLYCFVSILGFVALQLVVVGTG